MTAATITTTVLNPPITQSSFAVAIATACLNAGMGSPIDMWIDSGNAIHNTFKIINNVNATKGTIYFDIWITANDQIYSAIYDTWDTTAHQGTNASSTYCQSATFNLASNQSINFNAINHPELRLIHLKQINGPELHYGILRPFNIPSWWNENVYPYAFMYSHGDQIYNTALPLNFFFPLAPNMNPMNTNLECYFIKDPILQNNNSVTGLPDILPGIFLSIFTSNSGFSGKTSDDLILVGANSLTFGDILQVTPGVEEYTLITIGGATGVAIRTK